MAANEVAIEQLFPCGLFKQFFMTRVTNWKSRKVLSNIQVYVWSLVGSRHLSLNPPGPTTEYDGSQTQAARFSLKDESLRTLRIEIKDSLTILSANMSLN